MVHVVWQFRAKPDMVEEFRRVYGSEGAWAELFSQSPHYHGTLLLRDTLDPRLFMAIDRWTTNESFRDFRNQYGTEYALLDQQCLALTEEETLIGNFPDVTVEPM